MRTNKKKLKPGRSVVTIYWTDAMSESTGWHSAQELLQSKISPVCRSTGVYIGVTKQKAVVIALNMGDINDDAAADTMTIPVSLITKIKVWGLL